jgi:hypothetical protein
MKLSIASVAMNSIVTHNGSTIDGPKTFCNGVPGSQCQKRPKLKKFSINGFVSMDDDAN